MASILSKSDRTKQYIIEKTAPVFNTKGFAGTSINDLNLATGLSKGSIYGNFENKDEVALAVFDYNFNKVTQLIKDKILMYENAIDRLLVYPEFYKKLFEIDFLTAGCPILNTAIEADDTHPALNEKVAKALNFWRNSIENQILRGIERNEISKDVNVSEVSVVMVAIIEGTIMQAKVNKKINDLTLAMNFLSSYILSMKA